MAKGGGGKVVELMRVAENHHEQQILKTKTKTKLHKCAPGRGISSKILDSENQKLRGTHHRFPCPCAYLLLGDNSPQVPHVSACLASSGTAFIPNYLSRNSIVNSNGK